MGRGRRRLSCCTSASVEPRFIVVVVVVDFGSKKDTSQLTVIQIRNLCATAGSDHVCVCEWVGGDELALGEKIKNGDAKFVENIPTSIECSHAVDCR